MYTHRMHRTQLYLDSATHARLKAAAKRKGRTVSDVVREALELVWGPRTLQTASRRCEALRAYGAIGTISATPPHT